jgi:glycosyltransferase involved in cell wall biosynthesis
MKVSLIATVKDAGGHLERFLDSIASQARRPDEIVIVDGGSSDRTLEALRSADGVVVIEEPGANIARGRNVAISAATHDVIAVSDADCAPEPQWLERLVAPIEAGADVAMGTYRPIVDRFFQACIASINLPQLEDLDESTFLPSGRSVAFRREAIEDVGGYPEWLDIGEDMYVDLRWREVGLDLRLARGAVVWWPLRPTLAETWRQYFRYARGDAIGGMHAERHALRFGVYSAALYAWSSRGVVRKLLSLVGAAVYVSGPIRRAFGRFPEPLERARALFAIPALMAFLDAAKMTGWLAGAGRQHRTEAPS